LNKSGTGPLCCGRLSATPAKTRQRERATHYSNLQHTATHQQHTTTHCSTLQHRLSATLARTRQRERATHYNNLQHTATHHNTLQHRLRATRAKKPRRERETEAAWRWAVEGWGEADWRRSWDDWPHRCVGCGNRV